MKPQGCGSTFDPVLNHHEAKPDQELVAWLTLLHTPRLGCKTLNKLLDQFHTATGILEHAKELSNEHLRAAFSAPNYKAIESDLIWLAAESDHHIIHLTDPDYPNLLKSIPNPPLVLFVAGDPSYLSLPQLGIVGSRNPTASGLEAAHNFASELSQHGLTINSGLALGIDAAAHSGALHANAKTIAVIGSGLDRLYPARHARLAGRIRKQGAIISEFPPGTPPLAANFPRRNRIISGMSVGVLVIEAAKRSGSLITARLAAEQGREVFAMPGSIHNPLVRGCHRLIRNGACLIESTHDIVSELASLLGTFAEPLEANNHQPSSVVQQEPDEPLLAYIDHDPVAIDTLISRSGLTTERVSAMLSSLEIQGSIVALPGGRYCRS
ncbi:MAG: DNA-processing protein DprA [Sulfuriflexus sp.]|nr:DNA-processing protein DprA [Sulfuriflexus sp.]